MSNEDKFYKFNVETYHCNCAKEIDEVTVKNNIIKLTFLGELDCINLEKIQMSNIFLDGLEDDRDGSVSFSLDI